MNRGRLVAGSILLLAVLTVCSNSLVAQTSFTHRDDFIILIRAEDRLVSDTVTVTNGQLRLFLNQALRQVDQKLRPHRQFDTISTSAGVAVYALNSDCYENGVIWARVGIGAHGNLQAIKKVTGDDIGLTVNEEITSPQFFEETGGYVTFVPTPQEAWTVILAYEARCDLFGQVDADSADTIITMPQEYDQLLVDYTITLVKKRLRLYSEAELIKAGWKQDLAEARALIDPRPDAIITPEKERGSP